MKRYFTVWLQLTHASFAQQLATKFSSLLFLIGKTARFLFFLMFLFSLVGHTNGLAGYTRDQIAIFFFVFNIIDITSQLFLRGVYFFRQKVVTGEFDFYLVKPMQPLFRILAGFTDLLDVVTLVALLFYFWYFLVTSHVIDGISVMSIAAFAVTLIFGNLLALAFHIIVVSLGIITTEVDHTIMIYRDLTQMARVPTDLYAAPIRIFLTYIIPVTIIFAIPSKALLGLLTPGWFALSLLIVFCSLFLSLRFWKYALSQYGSASS